MPPKQRRIAIMGYRDVGKSSITIQFVDNQFVDSYDPTIENTFQKTLSFHGQEYSLQLVDTAGQDEFSVLPQSYFMNIDGYVLVYSVNSMKSFQVVKCVYDRIVDMKGNVPTPVILVGNKVDLHMEREVSSAEGRQLADSWKAPFVESSAKENQAVPDIFHQLISQIEGDKTVKGCILS